MAFDIHSVLRILTALQIFYTYIFLKIKNKEKKILSSAYFTNGRIYNIVSTLNNVAEINVENDNIVLTLRSNQC